MSEYRSNDPGKFLTFPEEVSIEDLQILLGGQEMRGTIRSKGLCPKCGGNFEHIKKVGYICPECKTIPSRFYVDLWHKGKRVRLFSDKTGQVLDSYQRAITLLSHINYEIQHHIFDPSKYVTSDIRKFLFEGQIATFLKEKEIEETKGNIAPSYIDSLKNYINNYYLPFFTGKDVRDIGATDLKTFYHQMPTRKEKTIKNVLDALHHFFRYLHRFGVIEKVPVFPIIRVPESIPSWTSIQNQWKLLNGIPEQHKPIFATILFQGMRPSEVRALKQKDIDLGNRILIPRRTFSKSKIVERTKGRNVKPRLIHLCLKSCRKFREDYLKHLYSSTLLLADLIQKQDWKIYSKLQGKRLELISTFMQRGGIVWGQQLAWQE
jgi:integrase